MAWRISNSLTGVYRSRIAGVLSCYGRAVITGAAAVF
jgi:hypothetical protein